MPNIIRRKNPLPDVPDSLQDNDSTVPLVKQYSVPSTNHPVSGDKPTEPDLNFLRAELRRLKSRNARLENEVKNEVKMLTAALNGEQETYDQVKRRISRLKGSLEYPGHD